MKLERPTPASDVGDDRPVSDSQPSGPRLPRAKPSTVAAYAKDLRLFERAGGTVPCDAEALRRYLCAIRYRVAPTTLYRRAMAVRYAHLQRGLPPPTTDLMLRRTLHELRLGIRSDQQRSTRIGQSGSALVSAPTQPMSRSLLTRVLAPMQRSNLDRRDRAMLLLGFVAALSRSQLVAIDMRDVAFTADAMVIRMASRRRHVVVVMTGDDFCAVTAIRQWIKHGGADTSTAPLFCRCDRGGDPTPHRLDSAYVSVVLKARVKAAGLDPAPFSAHSLRRGRLLEAGGRNR